MPSGPGVVSDDEIYDTGTVRGRLLGDFCGLSDWSDADSDDILKDSGTKTTGELNRKNKDWLL